MSAADRSNVELNPFRYRGYYYEVETGYYYLQTRYYNPEWGRFLNADGYINANGDILGYNMFAYCGNNPVMGYDPTGEWDWEEFKNKGRNYDGTWSLYDNMRFENIYRYKKRTFFHEQLFVFEEEKSASLLSVSSSSSSPTIPEISAGGSFTVITGGWENPKYDLSLFDMWSIGAAASLSADGLSLKLSACVWRPSVTYKGNLFDISVAANVGYCKEYSFSAKKKAITIGIITFSINVKNDD